MCCLNPKQWNYAGWYLNMQCYILVLWEKWFIKGFLEQPIKYNSAVRIELRSISWHKFYVKSLIILMLKVLNFPPAIITTLDHKKLPPTFLKRYQPR